TWEADAIVVERLHGLDDDNSEEYAKSRLRNACDDVTLDEIGEKFVYSNREGFRVLEQLADLQREMKTSREKNEHRFALLEKEIVRLRLEVEGRWLQEEALAIRRRFIDCFKRDVLKFPEYQRTDAIKAGNIVAHYGNAISDAYLFKHDNRMDFQTYSQLYGFQFEQVLKYCKKFSDPVFNEELTVSVNDGIDGGIFSVLNAHATLLAQCAEGKEILPEFEQAFRTFVTVAENCYPLTPMDDDKSQIARGYWEFWRLHKQAKN
ncbi:MAG: hypothetical protein Q9217_007016, partial [Psora testacea]